MPTPQYNKISPSQLDDWYNRNRAWADSKGYSKDLAQSIYIAKKLREQGADFGPDPTAYDEETKRRLYDEGFDGPNPFATNTKPKDVQNPFPIGFNPTYQQQQQQSSAGLQEPEYPDDIFTPKTNEERMLLNQVGLEQYKAIQRSKYRQQYAAEQEQLALQPTLEYFDIHKQHFDDAKNEITDFLKKEGNTWYSNNIDMFNQNFSDDADDWWRTTVAKYAMVKNEKGDEYAKDFINQAIVERVNDQQSGWEATKNILGVMGNMFVSGSLSSVGVIGGLATGVYNAITDKHDGVGIFGEIASGVLENNLVQLAGRINEQGTVFNLQDKFDPAVNQPNFYISPNNWVASGAAMAGFGLSSTVIGGGEAAIGRWIGKNAGRMAARATRRELSRSATQLAGETAEQYAKRLARIKKTQNFWHTTGDVAVSGQLVGGEAAIDAVDVYDKNLEYGEEAANAVARYNAQRRILEKYGCNSPEELDALISQRAEAYTDDMASRANPHSFDYATNYQQNKDAIIAAFADEQKSFEKEEMEKLDDYIAENQAVAIKTAANTFYLESLVLAGAEFVGNKAFRWESQRNLRRSSGNPMYNRFSGANQRGVGWDASAGRATTRTTTKGQNWGNAFKKWFTDQTLTEVAPEEIQNFIQSYNEAVGMNAIDQYIVARTNSEDGNYPEIGYMGENRFKTGVKAGWKSLKEEGLNTALTTYVTGFMPDLSGLGKIRQWVHRPEGMSIGEHISNLIGNQLTRNYFEQLNANKHVQFYSDEINGLLDQSPWLQDIVQQGLTLDNFQRMSEVAMNAGDMTQAQQSDLGQLVSLMIDMHASGLTASTDENGNSTNPLDFLNKSIDEVMNATYESEQGQKLVDDYMQREDRGLGLMRQGLAGGKEEYRRKIFDELKQSAQRMDRIRSAVATATDQVSENFETYDEDIQNALIFGKAFNEAFRADIMSEKQAAEKIVSQYNEQNEQTKQEAATINDIKDIIARKKHNDKKRQVESQQNTIEALADLDRQYVEAKNDAERQAVARNIAAFGQVYGMNLTPNNVGSKANAMNKRLEKLQKEVDAEEKKMKEKLQGKDVTFTAHDLVHADVEVRRWLLNRDNWNLLTDESKKNLSSLIDAINSSNPSFEKTARHAANLEALMNDNEEVFTAYISNPDKLTPVYNRVMRSKRENEMQGIARKLNNIQDYDTFKREYAAATFLDTVKMRGNANSRKNYIKKLRNAERVAYINNQLKDNPLFKRYQKDIAQEDSLKAANQQHNSREASRAAQNASEETKARQADQNFVRSQRNTWLTNYLLFNHVSLDDKDAVIAAIERTLDGEFLNGRDYFENSALGQFVKDNYDSIKKTNPQIAAHDVREFMFASPAKAMNYFNTLVRESASTTRPIVETRNENTTQAPTNSIGSAFEQAMQEKDDPKYKEPYDNDDLDTLARKFAYNFQLPTATLDIIKSVLKNIWFDEFLENAQNKARRSGNEKEFAQSLDMNKQLLNKLLDSLHEYSMDYSKSPVVNFLGALNAAIRKMPRGSMVHYLANKLNKNLISKSKNIDIRTQKERESTLSDEAVETIATETSSPIYRILSDFKRRFNVDKFLNSVDSAILTDDNPHFAILSGDMAAFHNDRGQTLNEELQEAMGDEYDVNRNGALIVGFEIDERQARKFIERNKDLPPAEQIKPVSAKRKGDNKDTYYIVVGLLPNASQDFEQKTSLIDKWRQPNTLWKDDEDRAGFVSDTPIYLHRNGFMFSFSNNKNRKGRPANEILTISDRFSNIKHLFTVVKKERKDKDGNTIMRERVMPNGERKLEPDTFRIVQIKATEKSMPFSVYSGRSGDNAGISLFIAPMMDTRSVSEKKITDPKTGKVTKYYRGLSIEEILKDEEDGVDMLREMHHTLKEDGTTKSWGRMGHFFYLMRKMLLDGNYDAVNNIIGSTKIDDETFDPNSNQHVIDIPTGYSIAFDADNLSFNLKGPDDESKTLVELPFPLLNAIQAFKKENPEDADKQASLENPISKELADQLDAVIFQIAKNLILDQDGSVRRAPNFIDDSFAKWNIYYGSSDIVDTSTGETTRKGSLEQTAEGTSESDSQNSTLHIYEDFYDAGLFLVKDQLRTLFFTDERVNSYTGNYGVNASINRRIDNSMVPEQLRPYNNLLRLAEKGSNLSDDHENAAAVTAITNIIDGSNDEFDPESPFGSVSTAVGNIIDKFARKLFSNSIQKIDGTYKILNNGNWVKLEAIFHNIPAEQLQKLAEGLMEIKSQWESQGYVFNSEELNLYGTVQLSDDTKATNPNFINYDIHGTPDIIAYNRVTGAIRIIDVKNKRTKEIEKEPKSRVSFDDKTKRKYTAQVSLYADMIEQMVPNAVIDGVYILAIPTFYQDPSSNFVYYSDKDIFNNPIIRAKQYSSTGEFVSSVQPDVTIGLVDRDSLLHVERDNLDNSINVYDRYNYLVRQLTRVYANIDAYRSANASSLNDTDVQKELARKQHKAEKLQNNINALVELWQNAHPEDDIIAKSEARRSTDDSGGLSGTPQSRFEPSEATRIKNAQFNLFAALRGYIHGIRIGQLADESVLGLIGCNNEYQVIVGIVGEPGKKFNINHVNKEITVSEDFLKKELAKFGEYADPRTCANEIFNCKLA